MGKTAFVFPGQGAQFPGMGKDLCDKYPSVGKLYDRANQVLGTDIRDISFNASKSEITESKNAQPCVFLHSIACLSLLKTKVEPSVVAGHSLGEYSALFAAGVLDFDDALHLVRFRGELMSRTNPGAMTAIVGMDSGEVERIVSDLKPKGPITVANYNSPRQTVISGSPEIVTEAGSILKEKGAKRVIQLNVSGAFHSSLMENAFAKFKLVLSKTSLESPRIPVVPNATGNLSTSVEEIRDALTRQMLSPVRWVESVRSMIGSGVETFIELGPGKVLSGLIKQIDPAVEVIKPEL
jgi:[acyl-carrier-protein] S-malonyltransferase